MEHGERPSPQERLPVGAGGVGLEGVVGEHGGRLLLLAGLEETEGTSSPSSRIHRYALAASAVRLSGLSAVLWVADQPGPSLRRVAKSR